MEEIILGEFNLNQDQNKRNIEHMTGKILRIKQDILDEMQDECKMTSLVANKMFEGVKVTNCPSCNTPNRYNILSGNGVEYYKCDNCGESDYEWHPCFNLSR